MRLIQRGLFSLALLFVITGSVSATEIHVPGDYPTIQAAVDVAEEGDTIILSDGIYSGAGNRDIDLSGKEITIVSENGPDYCVIDCEGTETEAHRAFWIHNETVYQITLSGLTIRNGNTLADTSNNNGAGILFVNVSLSMDNCIFKDNQSLGSGGASIKYFPYAGVTDLRVEIWECQFDNNSGRNAIELGGIAEGFVDNCIVSNQGSPGIVRGIEISNSEINLTRCHVLGMQNESGQGFGIVYSRGAGIIADCIVEGSDIYGNGSGFTFFSGTPTVVNCLVCNNQFGRSGGAFYIYEEAAPTIVNCTVENNTFGMDGGGIYCHNSYPVFRNCIFSNNSPVEVFESGYSLVSITYSDIEGGYTGTGNIDSDPLFIAGPLGGHYLSQTSAGQASDSPCLNSGSELAEDVCFMLDGMETCLDERTTRSDKGLDINTVDMGFHYLPEGESPTPTPTPSVSPTPTPTPTSSIKGMQLILEDTSLSYGEEFYMHYILNNPAQEVLMADIWIILDVYGDMWCYPTWVHINDGFAFESNVSVSAMDTYYKDVLRFDWPDVAGGATGLMFYGAAFEAGTFEFIGDLQTITWEYTK